MNEVIESRINKIKSGVIPKGYKASEVGIIPRDWTLTKLGFLGEFKNGLNYTQVKSGQLIRILGVTHFQDRTVLTSMQILDEVYIKNPIGRDYLLSDGDLVFVRSNGSKDLVGRCMLVYPKAIPVTFSGFCIRFRLNNHITSSKYINALVEMGIIKSKLQRESGGSQINNLNQSILSNVILTLPPVTEQNKILNIISTYEKIINLKDNLIALKIQRKNWLMQVLLSGKKRLLLHNDEWKKVLLKDICSKCIEKNSSFRYKTVLSNTAQHGVVLQSDHFDKIIANKERIDNYYVIHNNEFVYNPRTSSSAPCGPIRKNNTGLTGILSPLYTVFRIHDDNVSVQFLEQFFLSNIWHVYIKSIANYGARHDRMSIADKEFFLMPIMLPPYEEQTAIANILTMADREIELLQQDIELWKQKKKGLMQLLLTGIVRVTD